MRGGRQLVTERRARVRYVQHVRKGFFLAGLHFKYFGRFLSSHDRRERSETFALFYQRIDALAHAGIAWVSQNAAAAKGPRAKFHPILKPTDDFATTNPQSDLFADV